VIVVLDEAQAGADLEAGWLECHCGGRLRPWGHAAPRVLRHRGGGESRRRWRRGRCDACGGTHIVAAGVVPRRRDELTSIGWALLQAAQGVGHRPIAARLGLPAATVRNWIRRARAGAGWLSTTAMRKAHELDPNLGRVQVTGDPLADAVSALGVAAAAARRRFGITADPWPLIVSLTHGRLLAAPSG
jgi:hypothetical protein